MVYRGRQHQAPRPLNVIHHLLSKIPYEDLTPEPIELPPRQKRGNYQVPDLRGFNFVPSVYPQQTT